jgi:hypothetical protein
VLRRLPALEGGRIRLEWRLGLRVRGGRLHPGTGSGQEVHAAAFIRERRLALDRELLRHPPELARILVHELFHFVWVRLGNRERAGWSAVLAAQRGRGELGESARLRRNRLQPADVETRGRRWRLYCCESFCDTAAWYFASRRRHSEFTLGRRGRQARQSWIEAWLERSQRVLKV